MAWQMLAVALFAVKVGRQLPTLVQNGGSAIIAFRPTTPGRYVQSRRLLYSGIANRNYSRIQNQSRPAGPLDWYVRYSSCENCRSRVPGQVIGLFTVGLSEYGVVWLGTNWDREIQKGIKRNAEEAKRRALAERMYQEGGSIN